MPLKSEKTKPAFNEQARRARRWQLIWQIFLPLAFGIAIVIVLFTLVIQGGSGRIERSAQTASILLAIPLLLSGFVLLFLLIALSSGISRLIAWLPPQSYRIQKAAQKINSGISGVSRATRQPFLWMESWGNALSRVFHRRKLEEPWHPEGTRTRY